MKIVKLISLLVVASLFVQAGCKKEVPATPETLIANNWKLTDWVLAPKMQVPDSIKAEMIKVATMNFTADKKFVFLGLNDKKSEGTYKLSPDGTLLTLIMNETNQFFVDTIKELTENKMIIHDPMGNKLTVTR
jgi:hypothetical protein